MWLLQDNVKLACAKCGWLAYVCSCGLKFVKAKQLSLFRSLVVLAICRGDACIPSSVLELICNCYFSLLLGRCVDVIEYIACVFLYILLDILC